MSADTDTLRRLAPALDAADKLIALGGYEHPSDRLELAAYHRAQGAKAVRAELLKSFGVSEADANLAVMGFAAPSQIVITARPGGYRLGGIAAANNVEVTRGPGFSDAEWQRFADAVAVKAKIAATSSAEPSVFGSGDLQVSLSGPDFLAAAKASGLFTPDAMAKIRADLNIGPRLDAKRHTVKLARGPGPGAAEWQRFADAVKAKIAAAEDRGER